MRTGRSALGAAVLVALSTWPAAAPAQIIGGLASRGDAAVVGLANQLGIVDCTGTLISPRVVLTAAHCLNPAPARVFFGGDPTQDGVFVDVVAAETSPAYDPATGTADLGLLVLARTAPVPVPLLAGAAPEVGRAVRFVGFGYSEPYGQGEVGVKRAASGTVEEIGADWFRYGQVTCNGDSGGPAFVLDNGKERLAGVTSRGDSACLQYGISIRVDAYREWLDSRLAALDGPSCALDTRCAAGCAAADPDCSSDFPPAVDAAGGCAAAGDADPGTRSGLLLLLVLALLLHLRHRRGRNVSRLAGAALIVAVAGCGAAEEPPPRRFCVDRPLGDPSAPVELTVVARAADGSLVTVDATVGAPLVPLAEGGSGVRLSIVARNLDGCAVAITARLTAADDGSLHASGGTFVELFAREDDGGDGWGAPAPSADLSFIDLPAEAGVDYLITIVAEDTRGRWGGVTEVAGVH